LFYSATTAAMVVLLRPQDITEINGLTEAGRSIGSAFGVVWVLPFIAALVSLTGLGQIGGLGTAVSRLPFAVGVDRLLPPMFGKVHPRWATPYVSMLALGAVASFLLIAIQLGDTMRAAYQELVSLMVIAGFLPYLYIFGSAWKAGKRISALCGWAVSLLALASSLAPTPEIGSVWLFEGKLALGTVAVIVSAWLVYRRQAKVRAFPGTPCPSI
jgi:amino acid transporter